MYATRGAYTAASSNNAYPYLEQSGTLGSSAKPWNSFLSTRFGDPLALETGPLLSSVCCQMDLHLGRRAAGFVVFMSSAMLMPLIAMRIKSWPSCNSAAAVAEKNQP